MENTLKKRIIEMDDNELLAMVHVNKNQYRDDVIEFARAEVKKRKLDSHEAINNAKIDSSIKYYIENESWGGSDEGIFSLYSFSGKITFIAIAAWASLTVFLKMFFGLPKSSSMVYAALFVAPLTLFLNDREKKKRLSKLSTEALEKIVSMQIHPADTFGDKSKTLAQKIASEELDKRKNKVP